MGTKLEIAMRVSLVAVMFFGIGSAANASIESIGINFVGGRSSGGGDGTGGSNGESLAATDIAGVVAQDNWNNAFGSNGNLDDLLDSSGVATAADVTWGGVPNSWTVSNSVAADADGRVTSVNPAAQSMLDIASENGTGKSLSDVLPSGLAAAIDTADTQDSAIRGDPVKARMKYGPVPCLKFVFEDVLEILWLEAKIIKGLPSGGMVEKGHQPV